MKLNNRRTILVGLAFLSICTFWQMYDSVMTLILTDTFKLNETFAGAIMAADNVLALFLLPFFGALSDKTSTRIGRRMPFIVGGTAAAAILMNLIPLLDDRYAATPSTGEWDSPGRACSRRRSASSGRPAAMCARASCTANRVPWLRALPACAVASHWM